MVLNQSILTLKGVGAQVAAKLNRLQIYTLKDMIEHYPREYEDRRKITPISECVMNEHNNILAAIVSKPQITKKAGKIIVSFRVKDETGSIYIVFYGQAYMKNNFEVGEQYLFYGKIKHKYAKIEMESPEYEKVAVPNQIEQIAKITPIYNATYKLSQKVIRGLIEKSLDLCMPFIIDYLPQSIRKEYQLVDKKNAVMNIHFPQNSEAFFEARKRLVFEELFMLQLALYSLKSDFSKKTLGIAYKIPDTLSLFLDKLPYELTNAQKYVLNEIMEDMKNKMAMNRLVQGDVGSGKTVIAAIALFLALQNDHQAALMAPTEVLAIQHYEFLRELMLPFKIEVGLLTGSTTKKQKLEIIEGLRKEKIKLIIGTHALIEDHIEIPKLGLVITDEQHRFGVRQRLKLSEKGLTPDVIVMTATPIPRTLALILYGDMDISIINELPPGRQPIKTNAVDSAYHTRIYRFIEKEVLSGRQCYIICPMVEDNDTNSDLQNVLDYSEHLKTEIFPTLTIDYLHGKMKPKEKNEIMRRFAAGITHILVSTTVVEVGVNVPNATIMLIENAERFGLAQLHQLRGRVGRGTHKSYCILVSDSKNKVTKKRLKIMEETTDGFVIAETDLKLRGPGEFFGTKQHGLPEMKIANLYTDAKVLKEVQKCVKKILALDPDLESSENEILYDEIKQRLSKEELHHAL
ncbi:ATP-dependent DNA helicase RecG [Cellulosilyticum sp. I15G10I2]|uniref:ATP-dependent DNA helicase RecG n=1 Tax=Cellulosilyticum sp. I15G10I2 TaxID=1892843 RepID=UPI00085C4A81|nr:ATP-dependent DNA helicase RecG [Cellulosilyticum sp. I15G10I2]